MNDDQMMLQDGWLTPQQACDFLHMKVRTLYSWVKRGKIRAYRWRGKFLRFRQEDLDRFDQPVEIQRAG